MHTILLVEDEAVLRDAFSILLQTQPYKVDVARNGQEALELCAKNSYDLILLDLMMPVLDGIGFLEQADLQKTAPQTKVIVLSNLSSGQSIVRAFELGAIRNEIKSNLAPTDILKIVKKELEEK